MESSPTEGSGVREKADLIGERKQSSTPTESQ